MQFQKKEKRQTTVRFDSHHVRLRTGEVQRKTGSYMYRWTDKLGKRNTIYAATLEDLREQEEQILVDQHDGIKANIKNVTVNDVYELWCQLKRGIKDSTMKNYIYMYELFVKPTFGKKKLVQVKKSDVRRFYNQLIDDKVLKPSTVDVIHNIVHQVFQIAVDDDMIRSNPAANMLREIKMAHGSEIEKRKALTLEQEELFLGYFETEHYVFTHGWIPSIPNRDKSYSYISSWREADREQWNQARWFNGMDAAQTADENKTIVCGHWHTSYGHSKYEHKGTEFGEDADFSPYYGPGIIAIDACTAFSGKVNCLVIED